MFDSNVKFPQIYPLITSHKDKDKVRIIAGDINNIYALQMFDFGLKRCNVIDIKSRNHKMANNCDIERILSEIMLPFEINYILSREIDCWQVKALSVRRFLIGGEYRVPKREESGLFIGNLKEYSKRLSLQ